MRHTGCDAVSVLRHILEGGVVLDPFTEPRLSVVAHQRLGLALIVRQDAVVTRVNGRVVEPRPDMRPLAVAEKGHNESAAPQIALEETPAQRLVDDVHQLDSAGMQRNRARLPARPGHPVDAPRRDTAARQLHRENGPGGAGADNQNGHFTGFGSHGG